MNAVIAKPVNDATSSPRQKASKSRAQQLRAFGLIAPLFAFICITFLWPLGLILWRSVSSPEFGMVMHRTAVILREWDGAELPPEPAWEALVQDLREARANDTIGKAATAMNFDMPAARSLMMKTARAAQDMQVPPYKEAVAAIDSKWNNLAVWSLIKQLAQPITPRFYLSALDAKLDEAGKVVVQEPEKRIYVPLFLRTFLLSGFITLLCLFLGYPVAYLLSTLPARYAYLLMILVLLPFWTSLLVRTTAWIALLQTQGVINNLLVASGLLSDAGRVQLIFNSTGTVIVMTHILLPYMILPLYSVMKTISPTYMRAARSLGANQFTAYTRVYMPQTFAGVAAGSVLVFILAIGYYITPALVGGESGTLISNMISYHMQRSLNWSLAAALASLLLFSVIILYWLYSRLVGVDNMKLA